MAYGRDVYEKDSLLVATKHFLHPISLEKQEQILHAVFNVLRPKQRL